MTDEYDRLDPDELLKAIKKQERMAKPGQLKIFFGMAAGVGKTYAMLEEAQQKLKQGVNLVVGTINTHGREATENLLKGLPIVKERWITYKDAVFEEMDVKAILDLKPQLVLVDELAHSNVPGSKHPKRWQDVMDLLDAGIDVYTTLNVQHIESRKDIVEHLTGIEMRETVPDLILERASRIELIDLPPEELLQRLKEGKVYLGDQSQRAIDHFFQEPNLMALREISLRLTAEKVDHDLHSMQGRGWKTRERFLVAISASPSSEHLIRSARRLSFELDAPLVALFVNTGDVLDDATQARLNRNLNLARDLGAEVITTSDLSIASALQRIAKEKDITRLIVGRSVTKKFDFLNPFKGNFFCRLEQDNKNLDIIILRQEKVTSVYQKTMTPSFQINLKEYLIAIGAVLGMTLLSFLTDPFIGYKPVGFMFLLGILVLSFFIGRAPIFLSVILSALSWQFFFMHPHFSFKTTEPENITFVLIYSIVTFIMAMMAIKLREREQFLKKREETTRRLLDSELEIAKSTNLHELQRNICARLESYFPGTFSLFAEEKGGDLNLQGLSSLNGDTEKAAAVWVFQNGKMGGWSTDTLPSAKGIYFPILFGKNTIGVLGYYPNTERPLSIEEIHFIRQVTQQLGVTLELLK